MRSRKEKKLFGHDLCSAISTPFVMIIDYLLLGCLFPFCQILIVLAG
jgi:hypothetical protein